MMLDKAWIGLCLMTTAGMLVLPSPSQSTLHLPVDLYLLASSLVVLFFAIKFTRPQVPIHGQAARLHGYIRSCYSQLS
jgi:hypothetical protein